MAGQPVVSPARVSGGGGRCNTRGHSPGPTIASSINGILATPKVSSSASSREIFLAASASVRAEFSRLGSVRQTGRQGTAVPANGRVVESQGMLTASSRPSPAPEAMRSRQQVQAPVGMGVLGAAGNRPSSMVRAQSAPFSPPQRLQPHVRDVRDRDPWNRSEASEDLRSAQSGSPRGERGQPMHTAAASLRSLAVARDHSVPRHRSPTPVSSPPVSDFGLPSPPRSPRLGRQVIAERGVVSRTQIASIPTSENYFAHSHSQPHFLTIEPYQNKKHADPEDIGPRGKSIMFQRRQPCVETGHIPDIRGKPEGRAKVFVATGLPTRDLLESSLSKPPEDEPKEVRAPALISPDQGTSSAQGLSPAPRHTLSPTLPLAEFHQQTVSPAPKEQNAMTASTTSTSLDRNGDSSYLSTDSGLRQYCSAPVPTQSRGKEPLLASPSATLILQPGLREKAERLASPSELRLASQESENQSPPEEFFRPHQVGDPQHSPRDKRRGCGPNEGISVAGSAPYLSGGPAMNGFHDELGSAVSSPGQSDAAVVQSTIKRVEALADGLQGRRVSAEFGVGRRGSPRPETPSNRSERTSDNGVLAQELARACAALGRELAGLGDNVRWASECLNEKGHSVPYAPLPTWGVAEPKDLVHPIAQNGTSATSEPWHQAKLNTSSTPHRMSSPRPQSQSPQVPLSPRSPASPQTPPGEAKSILAELAVHRAAAQNLGEHGSRGTETEAEAKAQAERCARLMELLQASEGCRGRPSPSSQSASRTAGPGVMASRPRQLH